jgi:chromosome segregation ATPase
MMKNIRCHKFMEVTFNDRINFIVGKNGSGKSSILTAIRLALGMPLPGGTTGGKKGSGVGGESIIRDGSDEEAIVEVEFSNTGEFGLLDTSVFGDYFMIRRSLTRGESGRVVDKYDVFKNGVEKVKISKSGMVDLLRSKNVFATNPAMIMDQETGKLFFTGSARDQYKFFIEATCLQRNYDALVRASEEVKSMRTKVVDRQKALKELEVERKSAEAALNEVQRLALLKTQLTQAQTDVLFAQLSHRKAELEKQQKEMNEKWNLTRILEVEDKFKAAVAVQEAKKAQAECVKCQHVLRMLRCTFHLYRAGSIWWRTHHV